MNDAPYQLRVYIVVDPMRRSGAPSAETVAALVTAVVGVSLASVSSVVVVRVCRRRRRHKRQQQQQQQRAGAERRVERAAVPANRVVRLVSGANVAQRPRE